MKWHKPLNVVFHNPNSAEDTAKYLIKLLASSMAESAVQNGTVAGFRLESLASVRKAK